VVAILVDCGVFREIAVLSLASRVIVMIMADHLLVRSQWGIIRTGTGFVFLEPAGLFEVPPILYIVRLGF